MICLSRGSVNDLKSSSIHDDTPLYVTVQSNGKERAVLKIVKQKHWNDALIKKIIYRCINFSSGVRASKTRDQSDKREIDIILK